MSGVRIFLAGAGLMGTDIAYIFASKGFRVVLYDISPDSLARARERHLYLSRNVDMESPELIDNIVYTTDINDSRGAEFVFEAVVEDLKVKRRLFSDLERILDRDILFATNTSSYTVSELASQLDDPGRLVAMHFSNPPIDMKLVEVVGSSYTVDEALDSIIEYSRLIGKEPIVLDKDCRGFVLNRLIYTAFVVALYQLDRGVRPESIDAGVKGLGVPYGVVEGMDLIGLDVVKRILDNLFEAYGDIYRYPANILDDMISRGKLGKKAGVGFYRWESGSAVIPEAEPADPTPYLAVVVNEAFRVVEDGVADKARVDKVYRLGVGAPAGLFELADLFGLDNLRDILNAMYSETGHRVFKWSGPD